ncbi:hypothetical protein [Pseudanabaena sp. UWO310]|uniref:hypothetical protein n=1 Tax=Pseudanabaena sp. UWO310 TaxID=2480795 RepID=UPI00115B5DF8|nr:hypothetical protein [Pseudanabaena sp. UWO310]TYQ30730.1 hypothetical protein PseudUWO310_07310 [Pseudanabaena sp. UWO310]
MNDKLVMNRILKQSLKQSLHQGLNQSLHRIFHGALLVLGIGAIAPLTFSARAAIAEENITIPQAPVEPSLWWKSQRLQEGWVENIAIDSEAKQAIITVNTTRWIASDYLQRFTFLFKLGTEAQKQNFNVMLYNRRSQKIAEYSTVEERWRIDPKSLGAEPFRVNTPDALQQSFNR